MSTSVKDAKAIVQRCFEAIMEGGDLGAADELIAKDVVFKTVSGAVIRGRSEFRFFAETFRSSFPDIDFDLEEWIVEGERVAVRYTMRGTFLGPYQGMLPNEAEFAVMGIDTFRVVDGRITEIYASFDTLGQLQQLGVVPQLR